jgi:hypothetical protein
MRQKPLSRQDFLKLCALGLGGFALRPLGRIFRLPEFPQYDRLGRVFGGKVSIKARPDIESEDVGILYDDDVVPWLREIVGSRPLWYSQRFVEIPDGYVYAPNLQPVRNIVNEPMSSITPSSGMWVEVTVPYVDLVLANPPARSPWVKRTKTPRLYYSQIMCVDDIKQDEDGKIWYRVFEKYGTFGDIFWADARAFRPVSDEEMSPINPSIENKHVEVNLSRQTLSCYEENSEVYFCRVSTGDKYDAEGNPIDKWSTPVGVHSIWRKLITVHMTGGTTGGGYDLPGIGWTTLFSGNGVAIHSTFWHNSFGIPRSHGCVNAQPEDAKWIFRWTLPEVPYDPGDVTISGKGSTKVHVIES